MDDFVSESDSDYTSYWRDWVSPSAMQFASTSTVPPGATQLPPSNTPTTTTVPVMQLYRLLL